MQQSVVDYTFALSVASSVAGLLVLLLGQQNNDKLVRVLLVVFSLGAVLYTAWSAGALDVHQVLSYLAIALVPGGFHVALKTNLAPSAPPIVSPAATPAAQNAPTSDSQPNLSDLSAQLSAAASQAIAAHQ